MYKLIVTVIVWIIGIIGIGIMKKIQPYNKIYPVWVAFVCIVFTCFVISYGS